MNKLELLKAARNLISEPEHWTQGVEARDKDGKVIISTSPEAVKWCAYGAIWKFHEENEGVQIQAEELLRSCIPDGCPSLLKLNDCHTHEEVLAVYDRAIVKAEQANDSNV